MLSPKRLLAASALVVGGTAAVVVPTTGASASSWSWSGPLTGAEFSLQNYFNSAGELIPFFDQIDGDIGAGGFSQEEAAAAGIADEYHFTFEEKVSHLTPIVDPWQGIEPEVRFEDDYTVVIAIPGGTTIGDGIGLRVWLWPWAD